MSTSRAITLHLSPHSHSACELIRAHLSRQHIPPSTLMQTTARPPQKPFALELLVAASAAHWAALLRIKVQLVPEVLRQYSERYTLELLARGRRRYSEPGDTVLVDKHALADLELIGGYLAQYRAHQVRFLQNDDGSPNYELVVLFALWLLADSLRRAPL